MQFLLYKYIYFIDIVNKSIGTSLPFPITLLCHIYLDLLLWSCKTRYSKWKISIWCDSKWIRSSSKTLLQASSHFKLKPCLSIFSAEIKDIIPLIRQLWPPKLTFLEKEISPVICYALWKLCIFHFMYS